MFDELCKGTSTVDGISIAFSGPSSVSLSALFLFCFGFHPSSLFLFLSLCLHRVIMSSCHRVMSVCEELLRRKTYAIFSTHFAELKELPLLYPNCKNLRMQVSLLLFSLSLPWSLLSLSLCRHSSCSSCVITLFLFSCQVTTAENRINFLYSVAEDDSQDTETSYGIYIAEMCGFPKSVSQCRSAFLHLLPFLSSCLLV